MEKQLKPSFVKNKIKRIVGRGAGSGIGKTCKRGHKGLGQRAGSTIKLGFEGGQMALIRRLPKFGFSNQPHKKDIAEIQLDALSRFFPDDSTVDIDSLKKIGLILKNTKYVKILGGRELKGKFFISKNIKLSKKAKEKVEANGGGLV